MDRPIGSKHERFDIHYPVNYGYVPGTVSPDGEEMDAFKRSVMLAENTLDARTKS